MGELHTTNTSGTNMSGDHILPTDQKENNISQNLTNTCNASTQVDITVPKASARIQVNPKMRTRGLLLIDVLCISLLLKVFR